MTSSLAHEHEESAVGRPGNIADVSRTVAVNMTDTMRFEPAQLNVSQGETIRFVIRNSGALKHEFVLDTEAELKEHYQAMMKNPEMAHIDPNRVTVAPGAVGEVIWKFTKSGDITFACLQPGHYDAGMKGTVSVAGEASRSSGATQPKSQHGVHGD